MPLTIHRSARADVLVSGLGTLLREVPADPFAPDLVAVPSKGVERWIAQSVSASLGAAQDRTDGICANVDFPSPGRVVREALSVASGIDADEDPWTQRRLPWPLLEVIDGCAGDDWCRALGRHLGLAGSAGGLDHGLGHGLGHGPGHGLGHGRRMAVAQKLADLFTSYGAQRPQMLLDWLAGRDTDGYGQQLEPDHAWQAELWRRLRKHLGVDSPAERIGPGCARLRTEPALVQLPERLSIFGATRLSTEQLQVLGALAAHRDVHLWLPHPSGGLWRRIGEVLEASGTTSVPTRHDDPTAAVPEHPLVRSLGRDARELQLRLLALTTPDHDERLLGTDAPGTLLGALQSDLREDREPGAGHVVEDTDRSVQVHACHGRQRQVEVLREVLLGLLDDDPSLELRDIIVMCPDIESYAPLINATFGLETGPDPLDAADQVHPGQRLTVRLADRSLRQTNPVLAVAARLLELADSRLTVSEVLDLAAMGPVRRRFRFDDDGLERIGDWVRRAGVRWGLDADGRRPFGLGRVRQNTWQAGLDRLLVGVTMDEDDLRSIGLALPLDDVDSTEIDLAGRLTELLDRLGGAVTALQPEQSLADWVRVLADAVESLVDVPPADAWQISQARWQLTDAVTSADARAGTTLALSDVRSLLGDRLKGRPTRANFRTGHLTMCTMVPMRSVPHRVVCLLGLDDGVFPRGSRIDGDDILARTPRVGERDPRSEDRQLFLDAILAAQERLVILYTGADERTGARRPPAVPVGELLDVLDRTARAPAGRVRDRVLVRHPLQPFDPRNFEPGELGGARPFSFDGAAYDGSLALLSERTPHRPFIAEPLPDPAPVESVELPELVRFLEHPVKQFLRQRLGLSSTRDEDEPTEAIPVAPDPLEQWAIGNRLLDAGLGDIPVDRATHAEWLRGQLPPGRLGNAVMEPVLAVVTELVDRSAGLRAGAPRHLDVTVELPSGIRVVGTVPGVYGDCLVRVVYSRLGPKHRLRAWVQLLALAAAQPDHEWEAKTVGRGSKKGTVALSHLSGVGPEDACRHLASLVELYAAGMCRPLPLPAKASCAYAEKRREDAPVSVAVAHAGKQWRTGSGTNEQGEFTDADHRQVWGDVALSALLAEPADPADLAWPQEPHRFGQLARRLWTPLLDAETVHQ